MIKYLKKLSQLLKRIFHFNLSKKISGLKIISKERGFIISFLFDNYFSFVLKPKKSDNFNLVSTSKYQNNKFAIIIQGPIDHEDEFTLETVKIYKKIFPNIKIILSTWNNEKQSIIDKFKRENVEIILNEIPKIKGNGNLNLQLKSTYEAINLSKNMKLDYILKTRTDCRIMKPNTLDYLLSLHESFPVKGNDIVDGRLIASSIATCKYRIYGLTDICVFGALKDVEKFFLYEEEQEIIEKYKFPKNKIINETHIKTEILLTARYLKNIGHELNWTLEDWWSCLSKYFCVVSSSEIDFFWKKYNWQYEQRLSRSYSKKSNRLIEHSDWFSLYNKKDLNWSSLEYKEKWEENNGIIKKKSLL